MIDNETRGGRELKEAIEEAIANHYGPKYPKLKARWEILREERNGKAVAA